MQAIYLVFRLVQVLMVGLTVDEILGNPSWWAVLTPSMVYILVLCCATQADNMAANSEKTGLDEMAAEGPPEDSTFRQMAEREFKQSMKVFLLFSCSLDCIDRTLMVHQLCRPFL